MPGDNELIVGIADIKVGKTPQVIKTNLGSCVAVCLYSQEHKVGGMLHLMLARANPETLPRNQELKKAKYADTGIPELLNQLKKISGLSPEVFSAKIFGGAKVLKNVTQNIGEENAIAVKDILRSLGIRILSSKIGGEKGYKVEMYLDTGKVRCQIFGQAVEEF